MAVFRKRILVRPRDRTKVASLFAADSRREKGSTLVTESSVDVAKLTCGLLILVAATLVSLRFSSMRPVTRSPRLAFSVAARLAYVYGVGVFFLYWLVGLSANAVLIVAGVVFLAGLLARFESEGGIGFAALGGDILGLAVCLLVVVPVWMVKQFVLGFPDRDKIVLPAYSKINRSTKVRPRVRGIEEVPNEPLTVVATLRPMGKVVWGDRHFDAISIDGQYVDVGTNVRVQELRDQMFVVVPIARESVASSLEREAQSHASDTPAGE